MVVWGHVCWSSGGLCFGLNSRFGVERLQVWVWSMANFPLPLFRYCLNAAKIRYFKHSVSLIHLFDCCLLLIWVASFYSLHFFLICLGLKPNFISPWGLCLILLFCFFNLILLLVNLFWSSHLGCDKWLRDAPLIRINFWMLGNGRETLKLDWFTTYSFSCSSFKSIENNVMPVQFCVKWP